MSNVVSNQIIKLGNLKNELKNIINESEKKFSKQNKEIAVGFLWEHTLIVASIAKKIAKLEGIDTHLPEIAALFHDAGKFKDGFYHIDDIPEEEIAAEIAQETLIKYGYSKTDVVLVKEGLLNLYNENKSSSMIADLIHDADFLSKFGSIGVAAFFTKMALRGKNINSAVLGNLSKELTYASVLPLNMRTKSGRILAQGKKEKTIKFFSELISELRDDGVSDFLIRKENWICIEKESRTVEVFLVTNKKCQNCGRKYNSNFSVEKGIKCQKLILDIDCSGCNDNYQVSFCLPEIV